MLKFAAVLVVLVCFLTTEALGDVSLAPGGATCNGIVMGFLEGGDWSYRVYVVITAVILTLALKRNEEKKVITDFIMDTTVCFVASQIVARTAVYMFCWDKLVTMDTTRTVFKRKKNNKKCAFAKTGTWNAPDFITYGVMILLIGVLDFAGFFHLGLGLSISLAALGAILLSYGIYCMWYAAHPLLGLRNGRSTLKYLLLMAIGLVLPAIYDFTTSFSFATRAVLVIAGSLLYWVLFYYIASATIPDGLLYQHKRDAYWISLLGFIFHALGYIAQAVANTRYKKSSNAARNGQLIACGASLLIVFFVYITGLYRGKRVSMS